MILNISDHLRSASVNVESAWILFSIRFKVKKFWHFAHHLHLLYFLEFPRATKLTQTKKGMIESNREKSIKTNKKRSLGKKNVDEEQSIRQSNKRRPKRWLAHFCYASMFIHDCRDTQQSLHSLVKNWGFSFEQNHPKVILSYEIKKQNKTKQEQNKQPQSQPRGPFSAIKHVVNNWTWRLCAHTEAIYRGFQIGAYPITLTRHLTKMSNQFCLFTKIAFNTTNTCIFVLEAEGQHLVGIIL